MEMYAVVDKNKKKSKSCEQLVPEREEETDEAPTYDMVESDLTKGGPQSGIQESGNTYSRIDRSNVSSKTTTSRNIQIISAVPPKNNSIKDKSRKEFSKITIGSIILLVILSFLLMGLLITLIMAFIEIVKLQAMLNSINTSSSSESVATNSVSDLAMAVNDTELEANFTMLQDNFEMLKQTVNALFNNLTTDTMDTIADRRERLNMISNTLDEIRFSLDNEVPQNLTQIETVTNSTLMTFSNDVNSRLSNLRQNFTSRIEGINTEARNRLQNLQSVANQTILNGQLAN